MQRALSRIWTRVAEFIFYDDNHYTKCLGLLAVKAVIDQQV